MTSLSKLDGEYVDVGWFKEQGEHSNTSMTYPELAQYHATGGGGRTTPRDVLSLSKAVYPPNKDADVISELKSWLRSGTQGGVEVLLDSIGSVQQDRIKSLFGSSLLTPTDGNPDPLVDTGELRDSVSRKTSTSDILKGGRS